LVKTLQINQQSTSGQSGKMKEKTTTIIDNNFVKSGGHLKIKNRNNDIRTKLLDEMPQIKSKNSTTTTSYNSSWIAASSLEEKENEQ